MVMLEIDRLRAGYTRAESVLKGLDFSMDEGEFIGVVGPNGSGKSTLLRAITNVLKFWSGDMRLKEEHITTLSREQIARSIAVVPQDTYISFPYSVGEVVLMGRNPYLSRFENYDKKDKKIAKRCMKMTSTLKFKDKRINELSGGEIQRVIVARALTQNPDLLLLDEATSHLDIGHKKDIMDTVKKLNENRGLSVISVHHNLNLAARYCEKILIMDDGMDHSFGAPEKVLTRSNIKAVYGIDAEIHRHPVDGNLYVTTLDERVNEEMKEKKVHVVCGGGSSSSLFKRLIEDGYEVTAGVLNVMDSDLEKAKNFDIRCVTEAPFSPISEESFEKNLKMIKEADVIVLTDFPIGEGNIKNLEAIKQGIKDQKLILIERKNIENRDYTEEGKGTKLYDEIIEEKKRRSDIQILKRPEEVLEYI